MNSVYLLDFSVPLSSKYFFPFKKNYVQFQLKAGNTEAHSCICIKRNHNDFCWTGLLEIVDSLYKEQLQNIIGYLSFNNFRGICITQMFPYWPHSTLCSKD